MNLSWKNEFISSRIGRRLFLLFILCALVPILLLASLTYFNVTDQLTEQAYRSLQVSAKNSGMFVFMNLMDLESEINLIIKNSGQQNKELESQHLHVSEVFSRTACVGPDGTAGNGLPNGKPWPILSEVQKDLMAPGKTLVFSLDSGTSLAQVYMTKYFPDGKSILLCELNPSALGQKLGMEFKPVSSEFHIRTRGGDFIYSSQPSDLPDFQSLGKERKNQDQFRWQANGKTHLVSQWELFLGSYFVGESWVISTSRPVNDVLSPIKGFTTWFILVIILSVSGIALVSLIQIRRTIRPLEVLGEGTKNVAAGNFDMALEVSSNDELEDLAGSFNEMSRQLGRLFKTMNSVNEIGQAALSSLEKDNIIEMLTTRLGKVLACGGVTLCMMTENGTHAVLRKSERNSDEALDLGRFAMGSEDIQDFRNHKEHRIHMPGSQWCRFVSLATENFETPQLVLPMFLESQLVGVVSLSYPQISLSGEGLFQQRMKKMEIPLARNLADQFVVAISNANLVQNLNTMNWGILHTLARAVDAKTPWTSGHSERVCAIALAIGQELEFSEDELDILRRGALLHDLGKLGIPDNVLDKPGKLTDEEFDLIRQHPSIGARIMEPISIDDDIVSMIRHHHEHWDGNGYPDKLVGEAITKYALIVAVADVYDALAYDRPYREGWAQEKVTGFITERRGKQFAPHVVDALLKTQGKSDFKELVKLGSGAPAASLEVVK